MPVKEFSDFKWKVEGRWNGAVTALNQETGETIEIFKMNNRIPNADHQYLYTHFTLNLNNCPDKLKAKLPPTDCRLRPDTLALENGDFDLAADEKFRLEEKQRAARKKRAEEGIEYSPKYFEKVQYVDRLDGQ